MSAHELAALQGHARPETPARGHPSRLWAADVVTVNPDDTVDVQPIQSRATKIKVPVPGWYKPSLGDRVLVTDLNGDERLPVVLLPLTLSAGQPVLSYSRTGAGETAAVAAIRQALASLGLVKDSTTA